MKLAGVYGDMAKGQFVTVSEWMLHGNIMEYIKNNDVNKLDLVRGIAVPVTSFTNTRRQLHGAAQGLKYLHGARLAHGDLKGVGAFPFRDRPLSDI